jgi:hypothetical protein
LVVDPVAAAYKVSSCQAEAVEFQNKTVISNFENLLLLTAEVNVIFTAHTLAESVTTLNANVLVSASLGVPGCWEPEGVPVPGRYLI